ncbi:MAG: HlyD family efflux transporter periplasmic adaptor subunit [Alphaproteobacteria bacterium]|nr:HlyD family efflux transporter periplasmic adaptor subunit [Alphaproteobacteria bacterium]
MALAAFKNFARNGRYVRAAIGVVLLGLGAAVYLTHALYTISDQAVINARTVLLVTPIEGTVSKPLPDDGTYVKAGTILTVIENRAIDRSREQQLLSDAHGVQQRLAALRGTDGEFAQLSARLSGDLQAFRDASVQRLQTMVREARAEAESASAGHREADRDAGRKRQLAANGVVSPSVVESSEDRATRAMAEASRAQLYTQRLGQELDAARKGLYLLEARNDVPYTRQRLDELALRRIEIAAQSRELTARLGAIAISLEAEQDPLDLMAATQVVAPIDSVVWRSQISEGTWVAASSPIVTLIDCRSRFVNVRLPGRNFQHLQPGIGASVHVLGAARVENAVIQDVRGMGAKEQQDRLAAPIPAARADELVATLSLTDNNGHLEGRAFCDVGRRVEVVLDGGTGQASWFQRLVLFLQPAKALAQQNAGDDGTANPPRPPAVR